MSVVVAIDAGTTGVRSFAVRDDGTAAGFAYREFTQHFPRPGWVEHDAAEIWAAVQATLAELVDAPRRAHRRHRHHRPARDGGRLGPPHRPAAAPRHRVAGPAHRGALRPAARARASSRPCAPPPASCSTRTSPPPRRSGCSPRAGCAVDPRPRHRHDRRVGAVEPHRRPGRRRARHRAVQRQPDDALRHPHAGVVRRAPRSLRRARRPPCPRCGRRAAASA